jgi:hypothetical protein
MNPLNIRQAFDQEIQVRKVETERKRMNSKKVFADQLRNLPDQKIKKKKSTISMVEIPNEDATPKFERLSNDEEAILIAVNELPDEYEEMPALVSDTEDDEENETEGDLVSTYLQGEMIEPISKQEQKESLNLVFKGPVHRTEKKTQTGLNRTD